MVWFLRAFDLGWSMLIKRARRDGLRTAQYVSLYEVDYSTSRDINEFVFTVQCVLTELSLTSHWRTSMLKPHWKYTYVGQS
jgi:hypothetical protein